MKHTRYHIIDAIADNIDHLFTKFQLNLQERAIVLAMIKEHLDYWTEYQAVMDFSNWVTIKAQQEQSQPELKKDGSLYG